MDKRDPKYNNNANRSHLKSLERRVEILEKRLSNPDFKGNPAPQRRELVALKWAIDICRVWMLGDEVPERRHR